MSNWQVTIRQIEEYCLDIEADNENEACEKAYEIISTKQGKAEHHNDSDSEAEALEE